MVLYQLDDGLVNTGVDTDEEHQSCLLLILAE
jgi:hypothetical protein